MSKTLRILAAAVVGAAVAGVVAADGGGEKVHVLEREIESLKARLAALEARWTFASFMPNLAERFHVMHHAGEAGDWAVAQHELLEIQRLTMQSSTIDAQKGELMQSMLASSFEALEDSIEHGDDGEFQDALKQTIAACNSCHVATGASFMQVTLDVPDSLSFRHPHHLEPRNAPSDHTHGMSESMKESMKKHMMPGAKAHDDTGKKPHTH